MFKKVFKSQYDGPSNGLAKALQRNGLNHQIPSYSSVEYPCSGPTYNPSPSYSITPVEYNQSSLESGGPTSYASASTGPTPVSSEFTGPSSVVYPKSEPVPHQTQTPHSTLHSPALGNTKTGAPQSHVQNGSDGIKKNVVDIYCPLKPNANGDRRAQIPRDVREFRLAKVALIPTIDGKRTFVSFDVVFGEMDKGIFDLVEKYFSCCRKNQMTKHSPEAVKSGQVYTIAQLNIAYRDGSRATVYIKFSSPEEKNRFKADFLDMWRYVEHID
ncbi:hypothetical protein K458DRAFT_392762 [Lentithecium fluviatile CBS 122367]|uniref:Uncharacterized protein n=1 Tax=Lentithecium fluviatile CBS 122367 TaxID=1168545 RepID=A0A6G1IRZ7_9PLEO|nr:hypothetical protein K458DRAFT_392762 [Lentithecium fluviatile CBS 122367]